MRHLKLMDLLLIAAVATVGIVSGLYVYGGAGERLQLAIDAPGASYIYPLDKALEIAVPGPLGDTHIHIEKGQASIHSSPCPNQTCIAAPPISKKGEWSACLPNQIIIRVTGAADTDTVDSIAY